MDDSRLCAGFVALVGRDRRTTAEMLAFIDELDRRGPSAAEGKPSTFAYCVEVLHMSESQASLRIWAARTARRFPVLFDMVDRGEIHLSAIRLLTTHLTEENHREVLARARHLSARQCELLVAEIAPRPDVPTRLVTLPRRSPGATPGRGLPAAPTAVAATPADATMGRALPSAAIAPAATLTASAAPQDGSSAETAIAAPVLQGAVKPLSPRRYKLELTIGQETRDLLTELQELLSHSIPDGDPAVIVDRAIRLLLEQARGQRMKATERPRRGRPSASERTRSVPAEVQRIVWGRDGGQCAFVGCDGQRCNERRFLELHHIVPFARGGEHTPANIQLRCWAHNQHQADLDYGRVFMDAKRLPDRAREHRAPYVPIPQRASGRWRVGATRGLWLRAAAISASP